MVVCNVVHWLTVECWPPTSPECRVQQAECWSGNISSSSPAQPSPAQPKLV